MRVMLTVTLMDAIEEYDGDLALRRVARSTRVKYRQHLHAFAEGVGKKRNPASVSTPEIKMHLARWQRDYEANEGRELSSATVRNRITALGCFYSFLLDNAGLVDENGLPVPNPMGPISKHKPKVERRINGWLREDEDIRLMAGEMTLIEKTIIFLLRFTGLRVSEAVSLRIRDVNLLMDRITVRESKTQAGRRTIPILPGLKPVLRAWLNELEANGLNKPAGYFLCTLTEGNSKKHPGVRTKPGRPLASQFVWKVVKRVGVRNGIRVTDGKTELSPHAFRRTFGSDFINRGVRLEVISKLLGHSSTTVTEQHYAELLNETIASEVLEALET
jgi:integrase/recombinase XerD